MKNISLILKIIFSNLIVMSILGTIVIKQSYEVVSQYMQKLEDEKFLSIAKTVEPIISINLSLNTKNGYIDALDQLLATHSEIKYIALLDKNKKLIYTNLSPTVKNQKTFNNSLQTLTLPITDRLLKENSGYITLRYTYSLQLSTMIVQYKKFLFSMSLLFLLCMLILTLIIYITMRPLHKLSKLLHSYTPSSVIPISRMKGKNEIAIINNSAVKMLHKISKHTASLEKKIRQRTKDLYIANIELSEAHNNLENRVKEELKKRLYYEKELTRKSRLATMGEMLDSIAHQWRQPLMAINSILLHFDRELELRNALQKDFVENKLVEIENMTNYMSHTIEDFRNFFHQDKQKIDIDLKDILKKAQDLLQSNLKDISMTVNIENNITFTGYPNELLQVIVSILHNAINIFYDRNITNKNIFITTYQTTSYVCITIHDNAGGIQIENLEHIFKPYFSTKHQYGGTGLGLYICKMIIEESMHGIITVSNVNRGALFTIKLPKGKYINETTS